MNIKTIIFFICIISAIILITIQCVKDYKKRKMIRNWGKDKNGNYMTMYEFMKRMNEHNGYKPE